MVFFSLYLIDESTYTYLDIDVDVGRNVNTYTFFSRFIFSATLIMAVCHHKYKYSLLSQELCNIYFLKKCDFKMKQEEIKTCFGCTFQNCQQCAPSAGPPDFIGFGRHT